MEVYRLCIIEGRADLRDVEANWAWTMVQNAIDALDHEIQLRTWAGGPMKPTRPPQ